MLGLHLTLSLLLLLCLGACAAASGVETPLDTAALPAVQSLDGLRAASATDLNIAPGDFYHQRNTNDDGASLEMLPTASQMAFAIYQVEIPQDASLISIEAEGTGSLYLLLADYSELGWRHATVFEGGEAALALVGDDESLISPANYLYVAAVSPPDVQGRSADLFSITLTVEEAPLPGPTKYVAPPAQGGSDSNDGSSDNPWATLQHAADTLQPGETCIVRPGEYAGMMIQRSGQPGLYLKFVAQPGAEIVTENPTTDDGINIENWEGSVSYVWVEGFTVTDMPRAGIRIAHDPENGPNPHHITVKGNTCRDNFKWGILTGHVDDILIEGNTCSGSQDQHGIYVSNSGDRSVVRGNTCYDNAACGLHNNGDTSMGGDGILSDMVLEYNVLYNNGGGSDVNPVGGGAAINMDGVQDSIIRGNLIFNQHASGITVYAIDGTAGGDNLIINNTIIMAEGDGRWCVYIRDGSTGCEVYNNILFNQHSFRGAIDIGPDCLAGFVSDYNVVISRFTVDDAENVLTLAEWQEETGQDANSVVSSPAALFVDEAGGDFHILPSTPAHNAGMFHAELPGVDIDGTQRPQESIIDVGAFELQP